MTDTKKLREAIKGRGVSFAFIAEKIGMSRQGFCKKLEDNSDFKAYQMFIIKDLLRLTNEEARDIFFKPEVD